MHVSSSGVCVGLTRQVSWVWYKYYMSCILPNSWSVNGAD